MFINKYVQAKSNDLHAKFKVPLFMFLFVESLFVADCACMQVQMVQIF